MTSPQPERRNSVGAEITFVRSIIGLISQIVVGLAFMGAGAYAAYYALEVAEDNHSLLWIGIGGMVLGGMCFPSMFELFEKIYVRFLPNGLPFLGRRKDDPPSDVSQGNPS